MSVIKILVVQPNKQPYIKEIKNNIDSIYGLVYYPYKEVELEKNIYLICSKEAENNNFSICRKLKDMNIYSNFVIVKKENNKYNSLTEKEIIKYSTMFKIKNT